MALIKCPECGKKISDKASACPNCGCPVQISTIKVDDEMRTHKDKRRFIVPFFTISIIIFIICYPFFNTKPNDLSDSHYKAACKVLEITDDYLDYTITADECYDKIETIQSTLNGYNSNVTEDVIVESQIFNLKINISSANRKSSDTTFNDIVESRNELAKYIGKKER